MNAGLYSPSTNRVHSQGYTHWAYSDLDIAFGDLPRWITDEELTEFDIVSYGFGDQNRVYLRGQFTFHKNSPEVNQLWRGCDYLSEADARFRRVLNKKEELHFESAEGCYSTAVLAQKDLRVKYAVKALTDVKETDSLYKHGAFIGIGSQRDRSVIYKAASNEQGNALLKVSPTWFESPDNDYASVNATALQWEVGGREEIELSNDPNAHCMYWVQPKYQSSLCLSGVERTDTVFLVDGKLYKQRFQMATLPDGLVTAPFFHFQEWKRYYRNTQLKGLDRRDGAFTWVLTKEGVIPYMSKEPTLTSRSRRSVSPLEVLPSKWRGGPDVNRDRFPSKSYCLRSGPRRFPPVPKAPGCETVVSWKNTKTTEILHNPLSWRQLNVEEDVTLALTLQITARQASDKRALLSIMDMAVTNIRAWQGQPCVLVIHLLGSTEESTTLLQNEFRYPDHDGCLIAAVTESRKGYVSRKALMNMATDAAPTRWVISGVELERGMVLSQESSLFAHRQAQMHRFHRGHVFVVPQFAIHDEGTVTAPLTVSEALQIKAKGSPEIRDPADFEVGSCEDDPESGNTLFLPLNDLWWQSTQAEVNGDEKNKLQPQQVARKLEEIEESYMSLLTSDKHLDLFASDSSPILMVDNVGPQQGIRTSDVTREVEEFGGKMCYNVLRLAQLATLGYYINALPGAFAVSTKDSRRATLEHMNEDTLGASRCDGCIMFDEENESILELISHDEQSRPAKAAILWGDVS